jgi:hypothetical protein
MIKHQSRTLNICCGCTFLHNTALCNYSIDSAAVAELGVSVLGVDVAAKRTYQLQLSLAELQQLLPDWNGCSNDTEEETLFRQIAALLQLHNGKLCAHPAHADS